MILGEINGMYDVECLCGELYFSTTEYNSIEEHGCHYPVCPVCHRKEGLALNVAVENETSVAS